MRRAMTAAILCAAAVVAAGAGSRDDRDADRTAIRQAVLDYAEGFYDHSPERMERAISPLLTKRGLNLRPGIPISQMNAEMLIDATRGSAPRPPSAERHMVAEALDVAGDIASARVFSVSFNDYIHLARRNGRWQLVSVLWHATPAAAAPSDAASAAVSAAVREFALALVVRDGARVHSALHPVAAFRMWAPGTDGGRVLREMNSDTVSAALAGQPLLNAKADEVQTAVLGVDDDLASAKLSAGDTTMYVHLGLIAGRWQIVNTLGVRGAPAP